MKKFVYPIIAVVISIIFAVALVEMFFKIVPQALPQQFSHVQQTTYDPIVGSKLRPNIDLNLKIADGITYNVKTDSLGFSDIGFRDDGVDGEVYAVALGDSFTFGEGVNISNTWPEVLEGIIGREVVNMGVSGHGTEHELRFLKEYGLKMNPKVVIVQFHQNDYGNSRGVIETPNQGIRSWLRENIVTYEILKYFLGNKELPNDNDAIRYKDGRLDIEFYPGWWWKKTDADPVGEEYVKGGVEEMKRISEENGFSLYFFSVPAKEAVYQEFLMTEVENPDLYNLNYPTEKFLSICEEVEVECVDLTPILREQENQVYFEKDGHLNSEGNRIVAEYIATLIR